MQKLAYFFWIFVLMFLVSVIIYFIFPSVGSIGIFVGSFGAVLMLTLGENLTDE